MQINVSQKTCEYVFRWDYPLEYIDKNLLFNKTDNFLQMYKNFCELKTVIYGGKLSDSESEIHSRVSCVYASYHKLYKAILDKILNTNEVDENGNPILCVKFVDVIEFVKILVKVLDVYNDVFSGEHVENLVQFSRLRNKMYYDFY